MSEATYFSVLPSPVGPLLLTGDEAGALTGVFFEGHQGGPIPAAGWLEDPVRFDAVRDEFEAYFRGELMAFSVPTAAAGSSFQRRVWAAVRQIPYGETVTYGELANNAGAGIRAQPAGAAVGRNPLSIIVPCHRVVGAGGSLVGYSGGLERKRFLLALEARVARAEGRA